MNVQLKISETMKEVICSFTYIVFYPTSASELNAFFTRSMREKNKRQIMYL